MCVCACVQVEEELWEEEFIERCILELLEEEEQWEWFIPSRDLPVQSVGQLQDQIGLLVLDADADFDVVVSLLQPISCCCSSSERCFTANRWRSGQVSLSANRSIQIEL